MYSHELQTCDWPRNVGCEVREVVAPVAAPAREVTPRVPVSSRIRFSSLPTESPSGPSAPAHIQQIQTLPPPPDQQRIAPNPVITSRGQPSSYLQEEILKVSRCVCPFVTALVRTLFHLLATAIVRRGARYVAASRGGRVGQATARLPRPAEHRHAGAERPRRHHSPAERQRHSDPAEGRLIQLQLAVVSLQVSLLIDIGEKSCVR